MDILSLLLSPLMLTNTINFYLTNPKVTALLYDKCRPQPWFDAFIKPCSTVILVHGWEAIANEQQPMQSTANAYQKVPASEGCYNVITVKWSQAWNLNYCQSANSVEGTGKAIGDFVQFLINNGLLTKESKIECIGHSLGAHICGVAGRTVPLSRITGLEPAGPDFTTYLCLQFLSSKKLSSSDAKVVVDLQTNGGVFGTSELLGGVNFRANGGRNQPGCDNDGCSHGRAAALYEEAVLHPWFVGHSPNGSAVFGRSMPDDTPLGIYDFNTGSTPPYGPSAQWQ